MAINVGDVDVEVHADATPFMRQIARLGRQAEAHLDRTSKRMGKSFGKQLVTGLVRAGSATSTFGTIAAATGPAVLALGASVSALTSGLVALLGALGPPLLGGMAALGGTAVAAGQGAIFAKIAFKDFTDALGGNEEALKRIGPEGRDLVATLKGMRPEMDKVRALVRKGLFPGLDSALSRLGGTYFPLLEVAGERTGRMLGSLADEGARMLASGPWQDDFQTVTKANIGNLDLLGDVVFDLLDVIRNLLVTSAPLTRRFLEWASGASEVIKQATEAGRESGRLTAWFERAGDMAGQWGEILRDLSVGLFNVFKIGNSGGQAENLLTSMQGITEEFRKWTESEDGIQRISDWFAVGRDNLAAMGRFITDAYNGLTSLGSSESLAPLIDQMREMVLPPLIEFLQNTSASGALEDFVTALGKVVQVFADIAGNYQSLQSFSIVLGFVMDQFLWIMNNVPGAGKAIGLFMVAMGGWKALNLVGLGGALKVMGTFLASLVGKVAVHTGVLTANTVAVNTNSIAYRFNHSTLGTWLGVKAIEIGQWIKSTAAMVASKVAMVASTAATWLAVAAQWAWNAALNANPIGLIVIAIAALVGAIVLLWKKNETFRKVVIAVWEKIRDVVKVVVDWIVNTAWPALKQAWEAIAGAATTAWDWIKSALQAAYDFMKPIFDAIGWVIQRVVDGFKFMAQFVRLYFQLIRLAIEVAWAGIKVVFGWIQEGLQWLGDKFTWLYENIIKPVWDGIREAISTAWEWIKTNVVDRVVAHIERMRRGWEVLKVKISLYWNAIKSLLKAGWDWIWSKAVQPFLDGLGILRDRFVTVKNRVNEIWEKIKSLLRAGWNWVRDNVFTPFKTGLGSLQSKFDTVRQGIKTAWDKLKDVAKAPIKFVIQTVLNNGLIKGFNWIAEKIGGSKITPISLPAGFARGGVLPGYTPGRDVHRFYSPTAGRLDLSGGEAIMRPEFTRLMGGRLGIRRLNEWAKRGGKFAQGGVWGGPVHSYSDGGLIDWIKEKATSTWDWVKDKGSAIYKAVINPLGYLTRQLSKISGGSQLAKIARNVKDKLLGLAVSKVKSLWDTFKGAFEASGVGKGFAPGPDAYKAMARWVEENLPGAVITSSLRPGAITATGYTSQHSLGRAVDIAPPSAARFNEIVDSFGLRNIKELYYSAMGGQNILNGKRWMPDPITLRNHWNHIHWAMAKGGVYGPIRSYDRGGYLPKGLSLAYNGTGAPERVGNPTIEQYDVNLMVSLAELAELGDLQAVLRLFKSARVKKRRTERSGTVRL